MSVRGRGREGRRREGGGEGEGKEVVGKVLQSEHDYFQKFTNVAKRGPNQGKLPNEVLQRFRPSQMLKKFPFYLHFDR